MTGIGRNKQRFQSRSNRRGVKSRVKDEKAYGESPRTSLCSVIDALTFSETRRICDGSNYGNDHKLMRSVSYTPLIETSSMWLKGHKSMPKLNKVQSNINPSVDMVTMVSNQVQIAPSTSPNRYIASPEGMHTPEPHKSSGCSCDHNYYCYMHQLDRQQSNTTLIYSNSESDHLHTPHSPISFEHDPPHRPFTFTTLSSVHSQNSFDSSETAIKIDENDTQYSPSHSFIVNDLKDYLRTLPPSSYSDQEDFFDNPDVNAPPLSSLEHQSFFYVSEDSGKIVTSQSEYPNAIVVTRYLDNNAHPPPTPPPSISASDIASTKENVKLPSSPLSTFFNSNLNHASDSWSPMRKVLWRSLGYKIANSGVDDGFIHQLSDLSNKNWRSSSSKLRGLSFPP